ncbi:MAG: hypothetical protein ACTHMM_18260 [Agriterribacter sp.]
MELIAFQKARLEKNKLVIDDSISLDEWKELGQALKQVEGSVQFWIGDWARFGEKKGFTGKYVSPKVYDELEEITGFERGTIQKFKSIAESTSELRDSLPRSKDLSFSHYQEVAPLPVPDQKLFIEKAVEQDLSVRELREEIKKSTKQDNMLTLQRINDQLDWEKELKDLAKHINITYTKEQRNFLVNQIKL